MSPKEDKRIFDLLSRLTKTLGELLGQSTEVVLHDLRKVDRSIVAIANPQLTGRKIGDTLEDLGVHLFQSHNFEDMANYETRTKTGRVLRSCSVFVRDDNGAAIGALCVNQDVSALLKLRDWLDQALEPAKPVEDTRVDNNVEDVLSQLIEDAIRSTGRSPNEFSREDKIAVISYLDARGAFLIRYSMEKVASLLGISKFSIYNYLNDMRADAIPAETAKA
jgi:predicted transcriptional regulator YheO